MKKSVIIAATALSTILAAGSFAAGTAISPKLDPQPEPPAPISTVKMKKRVVNPVERKGINPQPEPPGAIKPATLEKVGLDLQPEPPARMPKTLSVK